MPLRSVSPPSTHSSQTAVRYNGNASTCFSVSIHRPGLGSTAAKRGTKPISRNGDARPSASARNTVNDTIAGWVSA